jgi:hypothetical protein
MVIITRREMQIRSIYLFIIIFIPKKRNSTKSLMLAVSARNTVPKLQ